MQCFFHATAGRPCLRELKLVVFRPSKSDRRCFIRIRCACTYMIDTDDLCFRDTGCLATLGEEYASEYRVSDMATDALLLVQSDSRNLVLTRDQDWADRRDLVTLCSS